MNHEHHEQHVRVSPSLNSAARPTEQMEQDTTPARVISYSDGATQTE